MSKLYILNKILDDPQYEGFSFGGQPSLLGGDDLSQDFFPSSNSIKEFGLLWKPNTLAKAWPPIKVHGRVRAFNDYPCIDLLVPAFSIKAVKVLNDVLCNNGELLPLISPVGEYFAYNVLTVADVLDKNKSIFDWYPGVRNIPRMVTKFECVSNALKNLFIFRIPEMPLDTFVTEQFVSLVNYNCLQGFSFRQIWNEKIDSNIVDKLSLALNANTNSDKSSVCNSVILCFHFQNSMLTRKEIAEMKKIMNKIDKSLYSPNSKQNSVYLGSLEGNDLVEGQFRLFFSCPNADALASFLLPFVKTISAKQNVRMFKKYGMYTDRSCLVQEVLF